MAATVRSLHRYPVKSMLGEALDEVELGPAGVPGDRGYAVLDAEDGTVASAKHPRKWAGLLAMRAAYLAEPQAGGGRPPVGGAGGGAPPPRGPIPPPAGAPRRSDDADIDAALSAALGRPVRLTSS